MSSFCLSFPQRSLRQICVGIQEAGSTLPVPSCQTERWMSPSALMPVEGCHHRFHPKTSGIPGARPANPGLSCRKPRVLADARSLTASQTTLQLISSTTTLYGPIHLNQSCYLGNEPRWRISLRSNYPLCLLHLSMPASPQALILLGMPSCSGTAPLPECLCRGRPFRTEGLCQR